MRKILAFLLVAVFPLNAEKLIQAAYADDLKAIKKLVAAGRGRRGTVQWHKFE